jgi:hypothetical protein
VGKFDFMFSFIQSFVIFIVFLLYKALNILSEAKIFLQCFKFKNNVCIYYFVIKEIFEIISKISRCIQISFAFRLKLDLELN